MSEQQRKQPIENLLDEFKLALKAPRTAETDKEPTLRVSLYENNPRLRVKTNMPMDKGNNNGYIDAAMNSHGFYGLMEMIREVARAREPVGYVIGVDGHPFIRGQRSKEKLPMGAICVERYEDGRITICVTGGKNRPLIEFDLMLDEYHHFRNKDGQPMDKRLAYKIGAVSWANMMEKIVAEALAITYAKPAWMTRNDNQQRGGYNGGGNNNYGNRGGNGGGYGGGYGGGNNGGGQQQQRSGGGGGDYDFDDDVPL